MGEEELIAAQFTDIGDTILFKVYYRHLTYNVIGIVISITKEDKRGIKLISCPDDEKMLKRFEDTFYYNGQIFLKKSSVKIIRKNTIVTEDGDYND